MYISGPRYDPGRMRIGTSNARYKMTAPSSASPSPHTDDAGRLMLKATEAVSDQWPDGRTVRRWRRARRTRSAPSHWRSQTRPFSRVANWTTRGLYYSCKVSSSRCCLRSTSRPDSPGLNLQRIRYEDDCSNSCPFLRVSSFSSSFPMLARWGRCLYPYSQLSSRWHPWQCKLPNERFFVTQCQEVPTLPCFW